MRRRNREARMTLLIGIGIAILTLTIAYSAFSEKLSINGTVKMQGASWDVHFEEVSASAVGNGYYVLPSVTKTVLDHFQVILSHPEDSVTFHFQAVNDGSISAVLSDIVKNNPRCDSSVKQKFCDSLIYHLSYEDGRDVQVGDVLDSNSKVEMKLTIQYVGNEKSFPKEAIQVDNLGIYLLYTQN